MALKKCAAMKNIRNSPKTLKTIPAETYNKCMDNWIKRWRAFIGSGALKALIKIFIKIRENSNFFSVRIKFDISKTSVPT